MLPPAADLLICPDHDPLPQTPGCHRLRFTGQGGRPVWAWVGLPAGPGPHPGLVLLHGSGHQADRTWVELWRSRGVAAIAPDLEGQTIDDDNRAEPDPAGMPRSSQAMDLLLADPDQQWWHQAVQACCRSHSILAALPLIDAARIGWSGISRGAVLALVAAIYDRRPAAIDLVYGSAFLDWQSGIDWPTDAHRQAWRSNWEPGPQLGAITCPTCWTTSPTDPIFGLDAWRRSVRDCAGPCTMSLQPALGHSQREGMMGIESDRFLRSWLADAEPLPSLDQPRFQHGKLCCTASDGTTSASLLSTADTGDWRRRQWDSSAAELFGDTALAELSPWCATACLAFHCPDGCIVTSDPVNLL